MSLLAPLVRTGMQLWYAKTNADRLTAPSPRDRPVYASGDPTGRRALLLGNGPTHGWGVMSHQLALTGQLGRALAKCTDEPWDVDYVGDELMNAQTALNWLGRRPLAPYDLVLLVLSMNDAVRLTPLPVWDRAMSALLEHLDAGRAPNAAILVASVQPIASVPGFGGLVGFLGQRHADRLNVATRRLLAELPNAVFTDLGPPTTELGRPAGSPVTYAAWAKRLAEQAEPLLATGRSGQEGAVGSVETTAWPGPAPQLADVGEAGREELKALENAAKRRFRVPLALVTVLDEHRQYFPTGAGPIPSSVPRELTYCDVAVSQSSPLVVPDGRRDPRFAGSGYLDVARTPFYAGTALRSRDGEVIGSFCLLAPFARRADRVDLVELQRFASEAEQILWRIEDTIDTAREDRVAVS